MRCRKHPEVDAIGVCQPCGGALCGACNVGVEMVICGQCLVSHNQIVIRQFVIELGVSVGLFLLAISLLGNSGLDIATILIASLAAAFIPFGWGALSRFFSTGSGFMHPGMRMTSLGVHLLGAALIGLFVGPFRIVRAVREIRKARNANAVVNS